MDTKKDLRVNPEVAGEQLGVLPEVEGDRWNWFYVCGECHGQINWKDKICKHCGREINWDE